MEKTERSLLQKRIEEQFPGLRPTTPPTDQPAPLNEPPLPEKPEPVTYYFRSSSNVRPPAPPPVETSLEALRAIALQIVSDQPATETDRKRINTLIEATLKNDYSEGTPDFWILKRNNEEVSFISPQRRVVFNRSTGKSTVFKN